jgi:hypothetical protein
MLTGGILTGMAAPSTGRRTNVGGHKSGPDARSASAADDTVEIPIAITVAATATVSLCGKVSQW